MRELNNELNEKELIQDNSLSGDSLEGNESGITTVNNEPSVADNNAIDSADEKIDSKTDTEDVSASANDDLQEAKQTNTDADAPVEPDPEAATTPEAEAAPEPAATDATEADPKAEVAEAAGEPADAETPEAAGEPANAETPEAAADTEPAKAAAPAAENAAETESENAELTEEDKKAKRKKILKICGGVAAALVDVYCLIAFTYQSKFTTGTIINGIDASGMTLDEYTEALTEKVESYVLTMKFRDKKTEKIKGTDVGYTYVADDGAQKLLENQNIFGWARGYFGVTKEYTVNEGCKFDEDKMKELATSLPELQFENMEVPTNAHLGVDESASEGEELTFEIVPETYGTQLIPETFAEGVIEAAKSGVQEYDVDKADLYVKPTIYSDDQYLKDSIGGFNEFLSTSVTYDLPNGEQEVLDASVLKNWIAMREDGVQYLNEEIVKDHVNAYVALLAMKVDDVHTTRVLHSTLQGDVAFPSETWGHMIDQETESAALLADIQNHNVTEREPAYSLNSTYAENFGSTYVEVDIENQTCFYYEDGELLWSSECVTGTGSNEDRETVRGIFSILNKEQGRTLRGPQLEDGSYSYESYVNYWMQFYEGYGLHDATWRSNYEFGGDTYWYSGSHGCVNLPYSAAESLYFMVSIGTYVLVF